MTTDHMLVVTHETVQTIYPILVLVSYHPIITLLVFMTADNTIVFAVIPERKVTSVQYVQTLSISVAALA